MKLLSPLPFLILLSSPGLVSGALIAHYDFTDGNLLDDEQGTYGLAEVATGTASVSLNADGSAAFPGTGGANKAHLQVTGPGGVPNFTVSFWMKTDNWGQGTFQGLFSNFSSGVANSWQIDVSAGTLRVVSGNAGFGTPGVATSGLSTDT